MAHLSTAKDGRGLQGTLLQFVSVHQDVAWHDPLTQRQAVARHGLGPTTLSVVFAI